MNDSTFNNFLAYSRRERKEKEKRKIDGSYVERHMVQATRSIDPMADQYRYMMRDVYFGGGRRKKCFMM